MVLEHEQRLLTGFRQGDTEALGEIYRRMRPRVERYLASGFVFQSQGNLRLFQGFSDQDDLDDAVAETFRKALGETARRSYDPARPFEGYLLRIARNCALQRLRAERRAHDRSITLLHASAVTYLSGITPAPLLSPEEEVALGEVQAGLEVSLEDLDTQQRRLVGWLLEGRSQREIAVLAQVRRTDVRRLIYDLRAQVTRALKGRGIEPEAVLAWLEARSGLGRSASWPAERASTSLSGLTSIPALPGGGRGRALELPARFGAYLLLEKIGQGGMAEVFRAKKIGVEGFERFVAVKLMRPEMARRPALVEMFIDEAKIAAELTHRNIGQILDLGRHQGVYFIAMEYIQGMDLARIRGAWRDARANPDLALACHVAAEVAEALDYAHGRRDAAGRPLTVVHRDVSPRNVLISAMGEVKIIDFGLAKAAIRSEREGVGLRRGTLRYMSPEQLQGEAVDGRSDIFSLGVVLYELLTLERLFIEREAHGGRAVGESVLPPSVYNRAIPRALEEIALKALAEDPQERFQTGGQMAEALRRYWRSRHGHYGAKELSQAVKALGGA